MNRAVIFVSLGVNLFLKNITRSRYTTKKKKFFFKSGILPSDESIRFKIITKLRVNKNNIIVWIVILYELVTKLYLNLYTLVTTNHINSAIPSVFTKSFDSEDTVVKLCMDFIAS